MWWYLDSSIALHGVLPDGSPHAKRWFVRVIARDDPLCSSALLRVEVIRTIRREGLDVAKAAALLDRVRLLVIQDATLRLTESIEPHIKSLDALHLAAAQMSGLNPTVVTHDENMKAVGEHLGLKTFDPLQA